MKNYTCHISECNSYCEWIKCENICQKSKIEMCCGKVLICAQKNSPNCKNESTHIKISEESYYDILRKLKCDYKCDNFEIIGCVLVSTYFYLFFQSDYNRKNNMLCVVGGKIDINNSAVEKSISIQMCYNLYNAFKNSRLDRSLTKNLKIVQLLYSYHDDIFILLMNGNNKTIIGQIEHLESLPSIGTNINFINVSSCHNNYEKKSNNNFTCNNLIIDSKPICICEIDKKKYKLIVHNIHHQYNKCYMIEF